MFENYVHTEEDLKAVEEALGYLERPKLDFIFKDRSLIKNTLVISFDSKEIFVWTKRRTSKLKEIPCHASGYHTYHVSHKIKIEDEYQRGWQSSVRPKRLLEYLPSEFNLDWYSLPKISGGLLAPFVEIHRGRQEDRSYLDPYSSRESYLATILHEFGHVYYDLCNPRYYSDNRETVGYMRLALRLYKGRRLRESGHALRLLAINKSLSETFAFCTDYYASSVFWPSYKKDVDEYNHSRMPSKILEERGLRLDTTDTLLSDPHLFAAVFGKIILNRYPEDWPEKLIEAGEVKVL